MFDESYNESWRQRYGHEPADGLAEIAPFLSHRSVRRYSDEQIPEATLSALIATAQSAATSSNLQSWSVISVADPEKRAAIAAACDHQKQVLTAPVFLVFLADLSRIDRYAKAAGVEPDGLDTAEMYTVAVIDASLAAERLVCAAEALGYGICYIGALRNHPETIKGLLNLPEKSFGVFGLCIGRPAENSHSHIKPKLWQDQIWFREAYLDELDSAEYDARMNEFFTTSGMAADEPWSKKSGRRVMVTGLSGREALLKFLKDHGLLRR